MGYHIRGLLRLFLQVLIDSLCGYATMNYEDKTKENNMSTNKQNLQAPHISQYNVTASIQQLRFYLYAARKTLKESKKKVMEINRLRDHAFNRRNARIILNDLRAFKALNRELYYKYVGSMR
jgi:hypothetical protein